MFLFFRRRKMILEGRDEILQGLSDMCQLVTQIGEGLVNLRIILRNRGDLLDSSDDLAEAPVDFIDISHEQSVLTRTSAVKG